MPLLKLAGPEVIPSAGFILSVSLSILILGSVSLGAADYFLGRSQFAPEADTPLQAGRIYDGSTVDHVDEFLRKVPENSNLHFDHRTFLTRGVWDNWLGNLTKGFRLKCGWNLIGAGTNSVGGTVFRLVDVPVDSSGLYDFNVVFSTGGIGLYASNQPLDRRPNQDQIQIRDLQIDCNYHALARAKGTAAMQLAAIQILGNHGLCVSNVLVRNAVSKKLDPQHRQLECFQVYLFNGWAPDPPGDYTLDRIAIREYQGGYTSAICINGNAHGRLQNCSVDLTSDRSQRYGLNFAAGINHFVISNNVVENATRGINNDIGPVCRDVLIANNRLQNCGVGMLLANSQSNVITGNLITTEGVGCGVAVEYHPTLGDVRSSACRIENNTFLGSAGEGISLAYENLTGTGDATLYWSSNNIVQHNLFSPGLQNKIPPDSIAPNIVRPGNRRQTEEYPGGTSAGQPANLAAVGFPSDIGPGSGCTYCPAKAIDTTYGYITRVRLIGTRLDMRSDWGDAWGYTDLTTGYPEGVEPHKRQRAYVVQWADVQPGHAYRLEVFAGDLSDQTKGCFRVYVDWDHSGNFDAKRDLVAAAAGKDKLTGTIVVPQNASYGSTRMRVLLAWGRMPEPCEFNRFWGEVEDYTINVVP